MKHVRERIDILCWLHEYNEKMSGLEPDVEHVTAALTELNTAKSFAELLALVLAVGNYMNGGSFRGGAAGFKLDALNKLADVRSTTQPGKTLLDFMVKFICQHHQGVAAKLVSELGNVGSAAKVAYSNISTELNSLKGSVRATLSKLDKVKDVAGMRSRNFFKKQDGSDCFSLQGNCMIAWRGRSRSMMRRSPRWASAWQTWRNCALKCCCALERTRSLEKLGRFFSACWISSPRFPQHSRASRPVGLLRLRLAEARARRRINPAVPSTTSFPR